MEARWVPTRHGGFRRTEVAQKKGKAQEAAPETRAVANADADGVVGDYRPPSRIAKYLGERSPDTREAGRFESSPPYRKRFILKLNERLGLPECPYVIRWRFETPWFSVRLHHWLAPDDDRAKHDHPWSFTTFVLKGGYTDASPAEPALDGECAEGGVCAFQDGALVRVDDLCPTHSRRPGIAEKREHLKAPAIRHRAATHQHTVFPDPGGCWTVIVTGPKIRNWGFWVRGKFVKMNKYFLTYGHHPCD